MLSAASKLAKQSATVLAPRPRFNGAAFALAVASLQTLGMAAGAPHPVHYLNQREAQQLDEQLMSSPGFSVHALMELAGLSVATAVHSAFPPEDFPRVLVVCGPGNNGGDGQVAARHLHMFGYKTVSVAYPKYTLESRSSETKSLYGGLMQQLRFLNHMEPHPEHTGSDTPAAPTEDSLAVELLLGEDAFPDASTLASSFDFIVDAVFGFSFSGAVRAPFDTVLAAMADSKLPLAAVDIPSGWDVERGPPTAVPVDAEGHSGIPLPALWPELLISLTAPKAGAAAFDDWVTACSKAKAQGESLPNSSQRVPQHWLGGRFLPRPLARQYDLMWLPAYPGTQQAVRLTPTEGL